MKPIFRYMLLLFLPLALISCGDKKESAQSCAVQLDEQKYSTVAENTNCTNYERGSAYLGRAGVSFENFLKTGATDNLTKTLGISKLSSATDYTTGNRGYVTKALCLIGANTIVTSSRCGGSSRTRSNDEVEISMFANIADLIYLNYGVLDTDSNGTVSPTETSTFTSLSTGGVSSSGGGTGLTPYSRFEVVAGSSSYIANSDLTSCVSYTDNYVVDPATGDGTCAALLVAGSITEIRPIFKLDSMTDITGGGSLASRIDMVSELTSISTALDGDFSALGISSTNSLRTSLSAGLSKLDNGATAKNSATCTAVSLFDVMYLLVQDPADNSTSSTNLKSKNLLSLTDLTSSVDSSLSAVTVSGLPMSKARL
ncbi:MAG: hypothetical protein MK510_13405, partial [SAR324 cluster bacterium]|nr:hypothetical protein [SAR324 cluster bacterium]